MGFSGIGEGADQLVNLLTASHQIRRRFRDATNFADGASPVEFRQKMQKALTVEYDVRLAGTAPCGIEAIFRDVSRLLGFRRLTSSRLVDRFLEASRRADEPRDEEDGLRIIGACKHALRRRSTGCKGLVPGVQGVVSQAFNA